MRPSVEVVVLNWRRPKNVSQIVHALNGQTVPCALTVIDTPQSAVLQGQNVDNLYLLEDRGPYTRYTAPRYDRDYTLFIDDDILPGPDFVAGFIESAAAKPDQLLGILGRHLDDGRYNYRNVERSSELVPVDMLVRAYWIPSRHLSLIPPFYERWIASGHPPILLDDDILMAWALRPVASAWLLPRGIAPWHSLPEPEPCARRTPNRLEHRTRAWEACSDLFHSHHHPLNQGVVPCLSF